ncbi:hypothetical protein ACA910_006423 [Epithemia clementina (nom. ined.)]
MPKSRTGTGKAFVDGRYERPGNDGNYNHQKKNPDGSIVEEAKMVVVRAFVMGHTHTYFCTRRHRPWLVPQWTTFALYGTKYEPPNIAISFECSRNPNKAAMYVLVGYSFRQMRRLRCTVHQQARPAA